MAQCVFFNSRDTDYKDEYGKDLFGNGYEDVVISSNTPLNINYPVDSDGNIVGT